MGALQMTKQLMIYETVTPISSQTHADWSVEVGSNFSFARGLNSVPLLVAEFSAAAVEQTIVFSGDRKTIMPSVILGMKANANGHVNDDGTWKGGYIPAFLRRYPFVFAASETNEKLTLCMDDAFEGMNTKGKGEPFFSAQGEPSPFLQQQLKFNQGYQEQSKRTQAFAKALFKLDILEPSKIDFQFAGKKSSLGGFLTINREKFKALPAKKLKEMMKADQLELCYQHLQSLNNLAPMAKRLSSS